jgi:hypothetical protein
LIMLVVEVRWCFLYFCYMWRPLYIFGTVPVFFRAVLKILVCLLFHLFGIHFLVFFFRVGSCAFWPYGFFRVGSCAFWPYGR